MTKDGFSTLTARTLKGLPEDEQVQRLKSAVAHYAGRACAVRDVIQSRSGSVVKLQVEGSDEAVILLALMALVMDDVATIPDSVRRSDCVDRERRVAFALGLEYRDILHFLQVVDHIPSTIGCD